MIWALYFIPAILIEVCCYILAPVVALFIRQEERTDRVKQIDNQEHTLVRDYLIKPLMWFQSHDNAVDEWWYGAYNKDHYFSFAKEATQDYYNNNARFRWYCRLMWLWRNCAYGFHYNLFSKPFEEPTSEKTFGTKKKTFWYRLTTRPSSWQLEVHLPLILNKYMSLNLGWKAHKGFPRLLYANRIIGPIRDFEK